MNKLKFLSFFLILAVLGFVSNCGFNPPHKSDEQLIADLQTGKDKFNRLLEIIEENGDLEFISSEKVGMNNYKKTPVKQLSEEQIAECQKLLRQLRLTQIRIFRGEKASKPGLVEFLSTIYKFEDGNNVEHYSYKGYKWRPGNSQISGISGEMLDSFQRDEKFQGTRTRQIDENWELLYYAHLKNLESEGY